jgi:hypothetical protein
MCCFVLAAREKQRRGRQRVSALTLPCVSKLPLAGLAGLSASRRGGAVKATATQQRAPIAHGRQSRVPDPRGGGGGWGYGPAGGHAVCLRIEKKEPLKKGGRERKGEPRGALPCIEHGSGRESTTQRIEQPFWQSF